MDGAGYHAVEQVGNFPGLRLLFKDPLVLGLLDDACFKANQPVSFFTQGGEQLLSVADQIRVGEYKKEAEKVVIFPKDIQIIESYFFQDLGGGGGII